MQIIGQISFLWPFFSFFARQRPSRPGPAFGPAQPPPLSARRDPPVGAASARRAQLSAAAADRTRDRTRDRTSEVDSGPYHAVNR